MKFNADIDIDVGNRLDVIKHFDHIHAAVSKNGNLQRHPSGIYVTEIPMNPVTNMCSFDYEEADKRGYFKLDILNVWIYNHIRNDEHLEYLMRDPDWSMLYNKSIVDKLVHLNNSWDILLSMPEEINSMEKMAMFLAIIRPSKKHLVGKTWNEISKTVWTKDASGYVFKKSHSFSYAQLVMVHMNLLSDNPNLTF